MRFRDTATAWELAAASLIVALIILGVAALTRWVHPGSTLATIVWAVCYVGLIVKDLGARLAFVVTAAICISVVPFLYALVLFIQLPLVAFGLTPFHAHVLFVRSLYGALVGASVAFFAFRERAEAMADEILPNLGRSGYRLRWGEMFNLSAPKSSAAIALVLLVPCLFVLPATTGGVVASGVIWGIATGVVEVLIALQVENQSMRQGWSRVALLEILTGILIVAEVGYYWIDRDQFRWFMEFLPAGAACYAATYGLIHLTTIVMARLGVRVRPTWHGDEVPDAATAAFTAVATGNVPEKIADAVRGYLDRDSHRTVRIRLATGEEVEMTGPAVEPILAAMLSRPAPAAAALVRRALIVATAGYADPALAGLRGPTRDADTLARALGDPATGGFEVDLLMDGDGATVRQRIAAFFAGRGPDDLVILHVSGHVVIDAAGLLHLAARDTELAALDGTGIPASFIRDQLDRTGSHRVVLILDCCFSKVRAPGTPDVVPVAEAFGAGAGRTVLTASTTTEYTFEGTDLTRSRPRPSVFTTALANGLATGEADLDGNGEITVGELYDYASARMRRLAPDPTPMTWGDGQISVAGAARSTE